ncbi:hypothetical protein B0T19DRAFT_445249 [Cercophora scortea]|uniref:Protein kinase domain-containing protein n=1 Tax=Cercophora scortea TaxID=314031 RepID=A0AAE0IAH9_9PEZI|nr:hypothetical protein B0T19DRAFT_445249 [Cercophora scortea]
MTHRDISTNSIFIHHRDSDAIVVKLGDVGVPESGPQLDDMFSTPTHLAPELFEEKAWNRQSILTGYNKAVDIWALGAVLAEIVCGLPDFAKEYEGNGKQWCEAITRRLGDHLEKTKDPLASLLLNFMLRTRPEDRKEAWDCHERSQLLCGGLLRAPEINGSQNESHDSESQENDSQENESQENEIQENESQENEGEWAGNEDTDSDEGGSGVGAITETGSVRRQNQPHNTATLLTPNRTSPSISGDSNGGNEAPSQAFQRSDAPSPPTASQMRGISPPMDEPIYTNSDFGESIFAESTIEEESGLNDSGPDASTSLSAQGEPEVETNDSEAMRPRESASTLHWQHLNQKNTTAARKATRDGEISVGQLLALDEAALVQHMIRHRDDQGRIDITHVKDWDDVPEAERIQLQEKFSSVSAQVQVPQYIDFEQVASRLANIAAERESSSRNAAPLPSPPSSQQPARSPTPLPDPDAGKVFQTRCYYELVDGSGQPPVALELLNEIYKAYASYVETLEPWLDDGVPCRNVDDLGVFSRPLARWKAFRRWQRNNRGETGSEEDTLMAFQEEKRRDYESLGLTQLATSPDFGKMTQKMWDHEQVRRRREHDTIREPAAGSFEEYADAARCRLRDHDFAEEFQLLEDPRQQDQRLTWIEYLEFEYWWLDKRARSIEAARQRHERAWEKIVDSGALRPGETKESLLACDASWRFAADGKPIHTSRPASQRDPREGLINRLRKTARAYENAKAAESRQLRLVQWALSQMPGQPEPPLAKPLDKDNKRKRQEDEEEDGDAVGRPVKKPTTTSQRQGDEQDKLALHGEGQSQAPE